VDFTLTVNGHDHQLAVDARTSLLDLLRDHLALTGTKKAAITVSAAPARCCSMVAG
jgi:aerobic-type carbon monoxide dehydrogenase small subunit (CoxS/CutS family)